MAGQAPPSEGPLRSWKEIATVFGRDVRTVQRWEKDEGLPVYRHAHHSRASVYAYPAELEAWWRERRAGLVERGTGETGPFGGRRVIRAWPVVVTTGILVIVAVAVLLWWSSQDGQASAGASPDHRSVAWAEWTGAMGIERGLPADLNGDGRLDLVLGATDASEVFVLFGPGPEGRPARLPLEAAVHITTTGPRVLVLSHVADVNGDGLADLLLSTYLEEPQTYYGSGESYLVLGRRHWPARIVLPEAADVTFTMARTGDTRVGGCPGPWSGDLNGDGLGDLVFGARDFTPGDRSSAGAAFVFYGRRQWTRTMEISTAADVTIHGSRAGEALGSFCATGDLDGDGRLDLVVTGGESTLWNMLGARGRVYVIAGRASWPSVLDTRSPETFLLRIDGLTTQDQEVQPLVGDLDGDGISDLLLVWPHGATAGSTDGQLTAWFGGPQVPGTIRRSDQADALVPWAPRGDIYGGSALTDLDTDGAADLVFSGSPGGNVLTLYGGPAWRNRVASHARQPVALATLDASVTGWSFVADMDGDGLSEFVSALGDPRAPGTVTRAAVVPLYTTVALDVRPDVTPNVVLRPGVLAVRTATAAGGDALDLPSARLAQAAPTRWAVEDFNRDGVVEAQVYFDTDALQIGADASEVILITRTRSGRLVAGRDQVTVIGHLSASPPPLVVAPPKGGMEVSAPTASGSGRRR